MAKIILTVTLNPVLDYVVKISRFSSGQDFYVPEFDTSAGGKGINVSRTLKNLQFNSLALGFEGGATGSLMKKILDEEKIRHAFIKVSEETRKSLTVIDPASSQITRVIEEGSKVSSAHQKLFLRKFKSLLPGCEWVVISGRSAPGMPDSFSGNLIALAKAAGKKTILDMSGKFLQKGLRATPFLVKPNIEEAEVLLKRKLRTLAQLKKATQYFLKFGVKIVIISLGEQGAIAAEGKDCWLAKAPWVNIQNTVGSGDAMIGGFLYGYHNGKDLKEGLRTAVAAGSANCLSLRPGEINRSQVMALRKKVTLKRLR